MAFESTFGILQQPVMEVILPFILIFTIVFAILQKVKIFGSDPKTKNFNVVIALVMGLAVIFPHVLGYYPPDQDVVNIINQSLPNVSVVLVAILMGLIIIGLLGRRFEIGGNSLSGWIAMLAFGVVIYIFGAAANWWSVPQFLDFVMANPNLTALVLVILAFAIIIWFITKEDQTDDKKKFTNQFDALLKEIK